MQWPDIIALRKFYTSRLGGLTQHYLTEKLFPTSEKLQRHNILGLGYAIPHLLPFFGKKNHVIAVTPAHEGGVHWPYHAPCLTAMAEELELPFANSSMDLVLLIHTLEHSEQPLLLMQEIWRVLAASGELMVVVPNRRGMWSRADNTPFGIGQPYSASQLSQLFEASSFTKISTQTCLFVPPTDGFLSRPHQLVETMGEKLMPHFGGLLVGRAKKQVYAMPKPRKCDEGKRAKSYVPVMGSAMRSPVE